MGFVMKSILPSGEIEYSEDSGAYVDKSIERAAGKIVWVHLAVCVFVGFFAAVGICIGVVKVLNFFLK
jgi:hypothetical protein